MKDFFCVFVYYSDPAFDATENEEPSAKITSKKFPVNEVAISVGQYFCIIIISFFNSITYEDSAFVLKNALIEFAHQLSLGHKEFRQ